MEKLLLTTQDYADGAEKTVYIKHFWCVIHISMSLMLSSNNYSWIHF